MSTFTTSMFDSIKEALNKSQSQSSFRDILKFQPGNSYEVRLLPNMKDPSNTFFHYYTHAWESFATGQFMSVMSPQTFGERDPIGEARYQLRQRGTPEEKAKAEKVIRREQWLVNVYVINDPTNPENNNTVKMMRYGKQVNKVIADAIEGEDADQFGPKVFDLTENGCSLRIRCDKQGDYPTYVASKFLLPGAVAGLDETNIEEIYNSVTNLEEVFPVKSYDELVEVLNEHFHCTSSTVSSPQSVVQESVQAPDADLDEEVPMDFPNDKKEEDKLTVPDDLLEGLDDL